MLGINDDYSQPTINIDIPDLPDLETQPAANANGSNGFNVSGALQNVLNLLDGGFQIYKSVNDKIGLATSQSKVEPKPQVTVSAANPSVVFGLSTGQLLLIAGGLAALLIVPRLLRK